MVKNGEGQKGVTQEQVYRFVYHRVFANSDGAKGLIAKHHAKLGLGGAKARL